jgi:large subunit ribosomal protein L18
MINKQDKNAIRQKRHLRIRKNLKGTPERPRLNVYRSTKHIYVQIIDDVAGNTICAASTMEKDIAAAVKDMTREQAAYYVGECAAKKASEKGISEVVFDRGGYLYTGRVQKIADGARAAGLKF